MDEVTDFIRFIFIRYEGKPASLGRPVSLL